MEPLNLDSTPSGAAALVGRLQVPTKSWSGLTVVYLHGFGSSQQGEKGEFFRTQALTAGLAFCSFDFQGQGESGGKIEDLTLSRNLEDLRRIRQELEGRGHRRLILLGSSMGGWTGLWSSALEPKGIVAGLYIAPALDLADKAEKGFGAEGLERWQRQGFMEVPAELVTARLGWGFMEDLQSHTTAELATRLSTPSLLLIGRQDTSVSWQAIAGFAGQASAQALDFHLFADGDHRLLDHKDRIWQLMLEFLRGRGILGE